MKTSQFREVLFMATAAWLTGCGLDKFIDPITVDPEVMNMGTQLDACAQANLGNLYTVIACWDLTKNQPAGCDNKLWKWQDTDKSTWWGLKGTVSDENVEKGENQCDLTSNSAVIKPAEILPKGEDIIFQIGHQRDVSQDGNTLKTVYNYFLYPDINNNTIPAMIWSSSTQGYVIDQVKLKIPLSGDTIHSNIKLEIKNVGNSTKPATWKIQHIAILKPNQP